MGSQYFLLFLHFQVNHVLFSRLYIPRILEKVYSTETSSGGCSRGEDCKFSHERPANVEQWWLKMPFFVCVPPQKGCPKKLWRCWRWDFSRVESKSPFFGGDLAKSQFCKKLGSDGPSKLPSRTEEPEEQDEVCRFNDHVFQKSRFGHFLGRILEGSP